MEIGVNRGPPPGPPQNYQQTLPPAQGYQTQGSYPQEGFYQVHSPPQGMPRAPHNMTRNPHAMGMPQQPMPSPNPSLPYPKGPRMMYNNPTGQTQGMINQGGPYPAKGLYVNEAQQGYMHQAGGMVFSPNGIHQQAGQQTRYNIQGLSPQGQFQGHMMYQGQGQMTAQQKQGMWYQEPSGMTSPPSGPVRFPGTRANGPMPMVSPTPTSHTPSPGQQMSRMMLSPNSQAQGVALGSHPHQQAQVVNQGSHAHPQGQIVGSHQLPQGQGINPGSHSHMQGQMVGPNQSPQGQMINPGSLPHPQGQMINPGSLPRQQAPVMNPGAHMQQYVMAQQRQHFSQHEQNLSPPQGMMGNNPSYRHQHYQYNQHAMQSNRHCRPPYVQIPMANQYNQSETPSIPYSQALESGYPSPGSTTSTPGPNIVNNAPSVSGVITDQSAMNYTSAKRGGSVYTMANTQALYTTTASSRTFVSPVLVKHSQETSQHLGPMSATPASNFMMVRGEMTPTTFAGPRHQPILISSSGHVIVSYPHQDIHTHQGPQSLQAMTRTSVTTLSNTATLPSSSAGSSMCTSQSPSSFTDSKHSISVASSLTHNETEQTACCGGSGSVVKSEHNKLSCSCASGNPSEHSSRFMVPASGVTTLMTSPSAVTISPSGVMPSSLLTRSPDTEQWLNRMKQSHQMHNIDSKSVSMSSLISTHSTVATGCCASSVSLPTQSDTPVGSSVMSGGRASVSPAISVPFAWRRELENGIVVYYSPSSSRLCSPTSVKEYLSSDGTCKCGLSCPLSVEKVFNFDPKVRSRPFFTEDIETTDDLNNLCNHKRKIIAMATLQKGNLQTSRALGAETQSASKVLEALSLSKKDVGKKKKTKVKGTGSSFDSSLVQNKNQMPEPGPVAMGPPASNPQSYPPLPNPMPHQTLVGEQPVETQSFLVASNSGSEIKMEGSPRLSTMPAHEGLHLNPAYKQHMQVEHGDKFQFANMAQFAHPARMHRPQNPFEMMAGLRQRMPQGGDATQGPMSFGQQGMMPVNQMFSFQLQMQAQAAAARNAGIAGGHRYGMPSPSLSNSSQQSSPSPGRIHNKMGDIVTPPPYYDQSSPSPNTIGPYRPVGGPRMMSPPEAMGLISPPMMAPDTSTPIPKKKKKKKKRDAANKAMSGLLDRNMPCPNVDVRQFTPRHMQSGSYAQASMASPPHSTPCFLDNPAAFLAHQAEMVSSKIQSTFTGDVAPPDSRPQKADTPKSGSVSSRPASVAGSMCSISEKCDSIVSEQDTLAGILSQDSSKGRQRQGTTSGTSVCKTETNIETGNSTVGEFPASCLLSATARAQITPNRAPGPYPNTWTDPVAKRFRAPSRPAPIQHVPPGGKQIGGGSIVYHHNIENQQAFHEGGVVNGGGILMVSGPANRSDALLIPTSTILLPGSAEPKNNPELAHNSSTNDTAVIKSLLQSHIQQDQLQAKVSAMLMGSKESATPIQMVQNLISGIGGGGTAPSLVNVTRRMLNMGEGFGNMVGNPNSDNNQLINGYHPDTVINMAGPLGQNMAGPLGQNMAGPLGHNISMSAPLEQNTCGVNSGMPVMSVAMVTAVTDSITQSISSSSALPITPQSQACTTVQSSHHQHSHNASNTSDFSSKQQGHDDHNVNNTTDVKSSPQDPNHNANISAYVKPCDSSIEAQNLPEHPDSTEPHSFSNNDDKAVTDIGVGTTTDPASSKGRITKKKKKKKKGKKIKSLLADAIQSPSDCKNSHSIADPQEHNADNQHFVPLNTTMEESESTDLNTSGESVRSGLDYARGGLLINQPEPGEIIRQTAASSLILNQAQALQHTFLSGQDPQLAPMCINPSEAQSQLTLQGHTNIIQTVSFMPNMVAMDPNTGLVQSIQMPITSEHDNKDGRMESDQVSSLSQSHMVQTMMQSLQIQNNMLLQGMTPAGPYLQPLGNALIPIYPSPVQVSTSSEEGGLAMVQVGGTSTQLSPYINPPTRTSSNVVSTQTEAVQTEDSCSELIEGGGRLLEDNGEAVLADEEDLNESSLLHSEEASFTEQDDQSQTSYLEQDVPSQGPYAQEEDLSQGIQSVNSADASTAEPNSAVDEASVTSSHADGPMEDSIRSSELNMDENSPVCKSLTPISSCTSSPVHSDTVTSRHDNVNPVVTRVEENDKASVLIKQERESLSTPVREYTKGSMDSFASSGDSQDSIKSDPFTETREVLTGNSPSKSHSGISPRRTTSMPVLSREEPLVKEEITPRKITPAMLIIQKHVENSVKLVSDQEFEFDETPTKELLDLRRRNLGLCSRTLNIQRNLDPSPQPMVELPPDDTRLNESLPPTLSVMKNSQVPPLKRRPVIRRKGRFQKKSKLKKLLRPKLKATIIENKLKPGDGELKPGDEVPKVPAIRIKVALNNNKLTVSDSSKEKSSVSSLDSHSDNQDIGVTKTENNPIGDSEPLSGAPEHLSGAPQLISGAPQPLKTSTSSGGSSDGEANQSSDSSQSNPRSEGDEIRCGNSPSIRCSNLLSSSPETSDLNCSGVLSPLDTQIYSDASRVNRGRKVSTHIKTRRSIRAELDDILPRRTAAKRSYPDKSLICDVADDRHSTSSSSPEPRSPRVFSVGDLIWGPIKNFPSWPGKLVPQADVPKNPKSENGKRWVRWFGTHSFSQVETQDLKTLTEGLEEHHSARMKQRKGRKMNSNLEAAIQEAMLELDRQTETQNNTDDVSVVAMDTKVKSIKKKKVK